jgi:hypothetical protein
MNGAPAIHRGGRARTLYFKEQPMSSAMINRKRFVLLCAATMALSVPALAADGDATQSFEHDQGVLDRNPALASGITVYTVTPYEVAPYTVTPYTVTPYTVTPYTVAPSTPYTIAPSTPYTVAPYTVTPYGGTSYTVTEVPAATVYRFSLEDMTHDLTPAEASRITGHPDSEAGPALIGSDEQPGNMGPNSAKGQ